MPRLPRLLYSIVLLVSLCLASLPALATLGGVRGPNSGRDTLDCEILLQDFEPIKLKALRKLHAALIKNHYFVMDVLQNESALKTLGFSKNTELGSRALITEASDHYILRIGQERLKGYLTFPPLHVWVSLMMDQYDIDRMIAGNNDRFPYSFQELQSNHSLGVLLDPLNMMRPYLEVKDLFRETELGPSIVLGVQVRCDSKIVSESYGNLVTRNNLGWFCRVPVLTLAIDNNSNREILKYYLDRDSDHL